MPNAGEDDSTASFCAFWRPMNCCIVWWWRVCLVVVGVKRVDFGEV